MKDNIKIQSGQHWRSINGTEFHVDDVRVTEADVWIHYTNTFTQQTYSCLEEAFRNRFDPVLNRG